MKNETALCKNEHCRPGTPRPTMPGSPVCQRCEDRAWEQLQEVARLWPSTVHGLVHRGAGNTGPITGTKTVGLDLDPKAVERRDQVAHDLQALTARLRDAGRTHTTPKPGDVPAMARLVGTHITWFTHHDDEDLAVAVVEQVWEAVRACRWLSAPEHRRRWYPTGVPCVERGVDDQGARVDCPGEYRADVDNPLGDLVCSEDASHVMDRDGARRVRVPIRPDGAARFVGRLLAG